MRFAVGMGLLPVLLQLGVENLIIGGILLLLSVSPVDVLDHYSEGWYVLLVGHQQVEALAELHDLAQV